ncbi:enoyl-CoA hydratase/carnithine racemase [Jatrophihabitans sp. GAS493]|uniref:enoyl-CoA hydratase/isomerase family protein n=1 Tax=Jatrophihabitans sp. GAS493 TaxID=1907575 RepID=UPI000BB8DA55|nr:enoyl-CoA hydratase/isomerase family protein [Jatrophihabitans sp. GAS493]SOD72113.1 enoyl-CoA hydratase/carnithine racemase [Jatrophihabitans sp. GAS493]
MGESPLVATREGSILLVRLNRPEQLNALDWDLCAQLHRLWIETAADREVRVVVLTGAGRGFCAGADVGDLAGERRARGAGVDDELAFLPGDHLSVPVIVAVNGVCAGGGLHFVADADIAIAADQASFLDPHVSVGQVSALEPVSLALRVPLPQIARLALLGRSERWSAEHALAVGLVTEVVPPERLVERAMELANVIAANSPAAVAATRHALRSVQRRLLHDELEQGWIAVQQHWTHPDCVEGPTAFAERRPPAWQL